MHKQLTATGLITLCLVIGAGVLLTAQVYITGSGEWNGAPVWALWIGELLVYTAALLLWAPGIAPLQLIVGLLSMFVLRIGIGAGAAIVSAAASEANLATVFPHTLKDTLPVGCSVVFAVLGFYPLRTLFAKAARNKRLRRYSEKHASDQGVSLHDANTQKGTFLFGGPQMQASPKQGQTASGTNRKPTEVDCTIPEHLRDHKITVPLRVLFPQMPVGMLRANLAENVLDEGMEIKLPLEAVVPQLSEALIQISVGDLLSYIPKSWLENSNIEAEEEITLPLEIVIPQLPEELLKLPQAIPHPWASAAAEEEKVLFARV